MLSVKGLPDMIFGGQSLQELSFADFENLVKNRIAENPYLEYKENAYGGGADSIREMLRDVTAIANAEGGYLIMGIREDATGHAEAIIPILDIHSKVQGIRQACIDGIRERIEGLEIAAFECAPNEGILAVRIPKSDQRPYMVARDNRTDFFRRYDTDKRSMTLEEIRSTILMNPIYQGFIEANLLASGRVIRPSRTKQKSTLPYVQIYLDKSVDQFLHKYMACEVFPQTLVIISPFISDLAGELINLNDLVAKINANKTITYVITRPPKEKYQLDSMKILSPNPYIEVRYNESIHAKLYICWCRNSEEDSFALFGSGNLTKGGVRQNLELGMMIYSKDHGRNLVRDLYDWSAVELRSQSKRIKAAIQGKASQEE